MIKPEILDAMVQSGCTAEQIASVVKAAMAGRSSNADRQARYRARKAVTRDVTTVTSNACDGASLPKKETSPTPPKEKTTLPENPTPEANASSVAPKPGQKAVKVWFEEFWAVYPQRKGANPRKTAFAKFESRVRAGADPAAIIAAAGRYAAELKADGKIASPFVAQAATWLNQDRFEDYAKPADAAATGPISLIAAPGTPQWQAWHDHKRRIGERTAFMEAEASAGRGYRTPTEWPPEATANAA